MSSSTSKDKKNSSLDSANKSKSDRSFGNKEKSSNTITINSETFENDLKNFNNLGKLRARLEEKHDTYTPIKKEFLENYGKLTFEEDKLLNLYVNEKKTYDEKNESYNLDDEVFEERARKIFMDTYELKEYLFYPYFRVEYSSKKKSTMIKVYYYIIEIEMGEENKKNEKQSYEKKYFFLLEDRSTYMIFFQDFPMIFQKDNKDFTSVTIISPNFKSYNEFEFKKIGNEFKTSFIFAQINEDFSTIQDEIKTIKYQIEIESKNSEKKKNLREILKEKKEMSDLLKNKYSSENLSLELSLKKKELKLLEMELKFEEEKEKEKDDDEKRKKEKIENIKNEIKIKEANLKKITIKIMRYDQEFDGLFFTTKQIKLSNSLGETLDIPPNCPIILEVKNHTKYQDIMRNIIKKIALLKILKLNQNDNIYFVGILKGINIKKVDYSYKPNNTIIISAEKTNFLKVSLYDTKEKKSEEKEESKGLKKVMKMLEDFRNEFKNDINELRNDVNVLKNDVNLLKSEVIGKGK